MYCICDYCMAAFYKGIGGVFYIDGPAGTGKTYLYNCILAEVRSRGQSAIAVASSGVAAILLSGGSTANSRFRIPLEDPGEKNCSIKQQSDLAASLEKQKSLYGMKPQCFNVIVSMQWIVRYKI